MSLVGVETGSGTLVIESESSTLLDNPGAAFSEMIAEVNRGVDRPPNAGMQRALLSLEGLFRRGFDVDEVQLIDASGKAARIDANTISRICASLEQNARAENVSVHI